MTPRSATARTATTVVTALVTLSVAVLAQLVTHGSHTTILPAAQHQAVADGR